MSIEIMLVWLDLLMFGVVGLLLLACYLLSRIDKTVSQMLFWEMNSIEELEDEKEDCEEWKDNHHDGTRN